MTTPNNNEIDWDAEIFGAPSAETPDPEPKVSRRGRKKKDLSTVGVVDPETVTIGSDFTDNDSRTVISPPEAEEAEEAEVEEVKAVEVWKDPMQAMAKQGIIPAVLEALKKECTGLTIKGVEDADGIAAVQEALKRCKKVRTTAVKVCKEGREDLIREQKRWISAEKWAVEAVQAIEAPLQAEMDALQVQLAEIERIEKEKEAKRIADRVSEMAKYQATISYEEARDLSDEEFQGILNNAARAFDAKKRAEAEEEEKRRVEREEKEKALAVAEQLKKQLEETKRLLAEANAKLQQPPQTDTVAPSAEPEPESLEDLLGDGPVTPRAARPVPSTGAVSTTGNAQVKELLTKDLALLKSVIGKIQGFKAPRMQVAKMHNIALRLEKAVVAAANAALAEVEEAEKA